MKPLHPTDKAAIWFVGLFLGFLIAVFSILACLKYQMARLEVCRTAQYCSMEN